MIITRIDLKNWMIFRGEQSIELPVAPIAIVARYSDNSRRSNWAGKTSLLESIEYALHGSHRKRLEDAVITHGEDEMRVAVWLVDVCVIRSRRRGGPTRLEFREYGKCIAEGDEAQSMIDRLLGMTAEDFAATVNFAQGDAEALVGKPSGKRREVVGRWLKLDAWDHLLARAKVEKSKVDAELVSISRTIVNAPSDARTKKELSDDHHAASTALSRWEDVTRDLEQRLITIGSSRRHQLPAKQNELVLLRREVARLKKAIEDCPRSPSAAIVDEKAIGKISLLRARKGELLSLVKGEFSGTCPVTRSGCPVSDQIRASRLSYGSELEMLEADLSATEKVVEANRAEAQRAVDIQRASARLIAEYNSAFARGRELASEVAALEAEPDLTEEIARIKADLAQARAEREAASHAKFLASNAMSALSTYEEQRDKHAAALAASERRARIANMVARAMAPSGIPARIAALALLDLEERANALLSGTGLSFNLAWERETQEPTPVCYECGFAYKGKRDKSCPSCNAARPPKRSDELEILVDDGSGGELEDVRTKSGGAKVLVAAAIRLAGGMMLRERYASPVAWALVDEPFGPLDAENRETLARTFAGMLSSVGLEQAFVVSHDATLLDALPARIVIERRGDGSVMVLE
jgi:DNA repair exonuclease SbcCD ATPase subunit